MSAIDLELVVENSDNVGVRRIGRIPEKVWRIFCDQAKKAMPEKGDNAWASLISEFITKHVITDQFTYILTEIPIRALDMLNVATSQANMTVDNLISGIFYAALGNRVHVLNIKPPSEGDSYHAIVITGLPDSAWDGWIELSKQFNIETGMKISPEEMIVEFFRRSDASELTIKALDTNTDVNVNENANGSTKQKEEANTEEQSKDELQRKVRELMKAVGIDD